MRQKPRNAISSDNLTLSSKLIRFIETLKLQSGSYVGRPFLLRDWQKDIIRGAYPDSRDVRTSVLTIPRKNGKCLSLDTEVPTPNGFREMLDVHVGDELFGPDGKVCKVTGESDIYYGKDCYRITLEDKSKFVADFEHKWIVRTEDGALYEAITDKIWRHKHRAGTRIYLPLCAGVDYSEKELPIDPYIYGVWYAHHNCDGPIMHRVERSKGLMLEEYCNKMKWGFERANHGDRNFPTYSISHLQENAKYLQKPDIPQIYLTASQTQRERFLWGIISVNGKRNFQNLVELSLPHYATDIISLLHSLGIKTYKMDGFDRRLLNCSLYFLMDGVGLDFFECIKENKMREKMSHVLNDSMEIIDVQKIGTVPVKCISVDSPSNCFVVGRNYVVTHNTEFCGGIGLAHMVMPQLAVRNQSIILAASDKEQAGILFDVVKNLILSDRELPVYFKIIDSKRKLIHRPTNATLKVVPAVDFSLHGLNPSVVFCDEAGNWPADKGRKVYNVLSTSFGAQATPMMWLLSTQGPSDLHFFSELVDYGVAVNNGEIVDPSFKLFKFGAEDGDDVFSPEVWKKANPALGDFRSTKDFELLANQAKKMPSKLNTFKNLFLNIRVEAHDPFVSREIWVKNFIPNIDPPSLYGKMAFVGIDLSGGRDLCALNVIVPDITESVDGGAQKVIHHNLSYFWKPEGMMEESELQDKVPYRQWVKEGYLKQTYGNSIDMEYIARALMEVCEDFKVVTIGVDRWKIRDLERELKKIGFSGELTPIGQGFKDFGPCVQIMESVLYNGEMNHFNHPILTWNARNAVVEMDAAGSKKLTKVKSFGRIDGMISTAMALRCWEMFKNENPNYYASFNSNTSLYLNDEIYKMME